MLIKLTPTTIVQRCDGTKPDDSPCLSMNNIPFSSLVLGVSVRTIYKNKDAIALPLCPTCGRSSETLFRVWANLPPTTINYNLKCAINFLGKKLKEASQLDSRCAAELMAEVSDPPVILSDYPPGDGSI